MRAYHLSEFWKIREEAERNRQRLLGDMQGLDGKPPEKDPAPAPAPIADTTIQREGPGKGQGEGERKEVEEHRREVRMLGDKEAQLDSSAEPREVDSEAPGGGVDSGAIHVENLQVCSLGLRWCVGARVLPWRMGGSAVVEWCAGPVSPLPSAWA